LLLFPGCCTGEHSYVCSDAGITTLVLIAVPSGRKHFFGELCLREEYMQQKEMLFEGETFMFPKNYDPYLKNMYGNYMEIPPVEKREHHVIYELKILTDEQEEQV